MIYDGTNLQEVLDAHKRWLQKLSGWTEDDKADLTYADLAGIDLRASDLTEANLTGIDFKMANLMGVDFIRADLTEADLRGANLRWANLTGANLIGANLERADLTGANFTDANLTGAYLTGADLTGADLAGADLERVDGITRAYLAEADLTWAKNIPYIPMACPDTGSFVAWKACRSENNGRVIVKLIIPAHAKRLSSTGRKCRADKAIVQEIQALDGQPLENIKAWSMHDGTFAYAVGETVTPREPFCENRWQECASGIHFFINRKEAVDY